MKSKIIYIIAISFLITLCVFLFIQLTKTRNLMKNQLLSDDKTTQIVSSVGKLIELPTDETPAIATIADTSQLQNQPFFKTAENGDHILIYTQNNKAILYRPSINKIINITVLGL